MGIKPAAGKGEPQTNKHFTAWPLSLSKDSPHSNTCLMFYATQKPRSKRRDEMAKAAAPYIHSKMPTAIVTPPPPGGPVTADDEKLIDLYLTGLHDEADEE